MERSARSASVSWRKSLSCSLACPPLAEAAADLIAALNAVDHEAKRVIAYYVCAVLSATW
jgi:hypothetical protein